MLHSGVKDGIASSRNSLQAGGGVETENGSWGHDGSKDLSFRGLTVSKDVSAKTSISVKVQEGSPQLVESQPDQTLQWLRPC